MIFKNILILMATACAVASSAFSGLRVDISHTRSQSEAMFLADQAVRQFNRNFVRLTRPMAPRKFLTLPTTVRLRQNGRDLPPPSGRGRGPDLNLVFAASGSRSFPPPYKDLLIETFNRARPVLNAVFGEPSVGGDVSVSNYDADIGDRDAVAGGYYVSNNGNGQAEIRFPVYEDQIGFKTEVAAINFVHCLLLAYLGPNAYFADAFNEGLVRAATMIVARTPGALPSAADPVAVEQTLESLYDVGAYYDWWNASALACRQFIAPNLRNQSLPVGGSTGGVYLLRYQMSGSAWLKLLIEHRAFISDFNARFYANPSVYTTSEALIQLASQSLIAVSGNALVEGRPIAEWFAKQHVLRVENAPGKKLMLQPFPIESGLSGDDFGVFALQAHYFETKANGDEMLLSGTSYPIYWTPSFTRISATAQDDVIGIQLGYGSVVPNFTNSFDNASYRVCIDVPLNGNLARTLLPAGAIATPSSIEPSHFFGTLAGGLDGAAYSVSLSWTGGSAGPIPVTNSAFGAIISDTSFDSAQPITITVKRGAGASATTVLTRKVSKSVGRLAVNLVLDPLEQFTINVPKGLSMIGFGFGPNRQDFQSVFGTGLGARYDAAKGRYDIYPDAGVLDQGASYFVRSDVAKSIPVTGIAIKNTPTAVSLKPGWNMVANPLPSSVTIANILVAKTTETPVSFHDAVGTIVGPDLFGFSRGANDPVTGVPEGGSFVALTTLASGQAFMVRVLEPTGATLLFNPNSSNAPGREPYAPGDWLIHVSVDAGDEACAAQFGQSQTATSGYDLREDGVLPPLFGGLQARIGNNYYRDVRKSKTAATYSLNLDGLRPGQKYRVRVDPIAGAMPKVTLYDARVRMKRTYTKPATYSFKADAITRRIEFTVSK